MQKKAKNKIKTLIENTQKRLKDSEPKKALNIYPNILTDIQKEKELEIDYLLTQLDNQYKELLPFVKKIKLSISDITEQTFICATYLLLCRIFDNWESIFILAKNGKSSAIGDIIRPIKEGLMQVKLFSIDSSDMNRTNLDKWFSGDIITHGVGREKFTKFYKKENLEGENINDLSTQVYSIESQVPHNGYASILESISPFTEDYDFNGCTSYHRTVAWLKYAIGSLESTNIAMKFVYSDIMKDMDGYQKLSEILIKYNPIYKTS